MKEIELDSPSLPNANPAKSGGFNLSKLSPRQKLLLGAAGVGAVLGIVVLISNRNSGPSQPTVGASDNTSTPTGDSESDTDNADDTSALEAILDAINNQNETNSAYQDALYSDLSNILAGIGNSFNSGYGYADAGFSDSYGSGYYTDAGIIEQPPINYDTGLSVVGNEDSLMSGALRGVLSDTPTPDLRTGKVTNYDNLGRSEGNDFDNDLAFISGEKPTNAIALGNRNPELQQTSTGKRTGPTSATNNNANNSAALRAALTRDLTPNTKGKSPNPITRSNPVTSTPVNNNAGKGAAIPTANKASTKPVKTKE